MHDPGYVFAGILVAAVVTWALRALPFAMLAPLRDSDLLAYLGRRMPIGVMVILVAYTLRDVDVGSLRSAGPAALALAATLALQLWRRNATLSIFAGTALYVALASTVGA